MTAEERVLLDHKRLVGETADSDLADLNWEADAVRDHRKATVAVEAEREKPSLVLVRIALNRPRVDNGSAVHTEKILHITQNVVNIVRHLDNSPYYADLMGTWIHFRGFGV